MKPPSQATIRIQAEKVDALYGIPFGTLVRCEVWSPNNNDIVVFMGELVTSPGLIQKVHDYCVANNILVTHIDVQHSPPSMDYWGGQPCPIEDKIDDCIIKNQAVKNEETKLLNKHMNLYDKNYISGKAVVKSMGLDYDDQEMAAIAEQWAYDIPQPAAQSKLPVGELEEA